MLQLGDFGELSISKFTTPFFNPKSGRNYSHTNSYFFRHDSYFVR